MNNYFDNVFYNTNIFINISIIYILYHIVLYYKQIWIFGINHS